MEAEFRRGLQKLEAISDVRKKFTPIENDAENGVANAVQKVSQDVWELLWKKYIIAMQENEMNNTQDRIDLLNGRIRRLREQYQRDRKDAVGLLTSLQMDLQKDSFQMLSVTDGSVDEAKALLELVGKLNGQRQEIDENLATLHTLTGSV